MKRRFPLIIFVAALLLAGCNLPWRSSPATETPPIAVSGEPAALPLAPTSTPVTQIYMPQQMDSGTSASSERPVSASPIPGLLYFWPTQLPAEAALNPVQSLADGSGYSLVFDLPQATIALLGGEPAAQEWDLAVQNGTPISVRGNPGFSFGTGGGFTLHWQEAGQYYLVGGAGMSLEQAQALVDSLQVIDQATFLGLIAP